MTDNGHNGAKVNLPSYTNDNARCLMHGRLNVIISYLGGKASKPKADANSSLFQALDKSRMSKHVLKGILIFFFCSSQQRVMMVYLQDKS